MTRHERLVCSINDSLMILDLFEVWADNTSVGSIKTLWVSPDKARQTQAGRVRRQTSHGCSLEWVKQPFLHLIVAYQVGINYHANTFQTSPSQQSIACAPFLSNKRLAKWTRSRKMPKWHWSSTLRGNARVVVCNYNFETNLRISRSICVALRNVFRWN